MGRSPPDCFARTSPTPTTFYSCTMKFTKVIRACFVPPFRMSHQHASIRDHEVRPFVASNVFYVSRSAFHARQPARQPARYVMSRRLQSLLSALCTRVCACAHAFARTHTGHACTGVPHLVQNLAPGCSAAPHFEQPDAAGLPQTVQNLAPGGSTAPQLQA